MEAVGGICPVRDFTLDKYRELCNALLENGYSILTVYDYLLKCQNELSTSSQYAIMRHDVDRRPGNALRMAELEHDLGIRSTYYFRYPSTFKPAIMRKIWDLGHEIGYHYEVLAKARGNTEKAIDMFEQELQAMREICEIKTICMHGSPLSRYDNRDLWKKYDFHEHGVIGEGYLSFAGTKIQYFTDTGRSWSGKFSIRDILQGKETITIKSTDELIRLIASSTKAEVYLTIHPERWAASGGEWIMNYFKDAVLNCGKKILIMRP